MSVAPEVRPDAGGTVAAVANAEAPHAEATAALRVRGILRRMRTSKSAIVGVAIVLGVLLAALLAPVLGLPDPTHTNLSEQQLGLFSPGHLLGTDQLGRDTLSRLVWGARPALVAGVLPVLIAGVLGTLLGGVVGFAGGWVESASMRTVDVFLAIPPVMMAIAVAATLGSGIWNVVIAMSLVLVAPITRVARGAVMTVKNETYVTAARSLGVTERKLFMRHVLPNAASPIIAYAFSLVGIMIVFASGLSFIGLGVQPPTADWGRMVNDGRLLLATDPLLATLPGMAIVVVGLGFGLVGEWIDKTVRRG